jgi:hypothetical protein
LFDPSVRRVNHSSGADVIPDPEGAGQAAPGSVLPWRDAFFPQPLAKIIRRGKTPIAGFARLND